jgi:hypothetical protein
LTILATLRSVKRAADLAALSDGPENGTVRDPGGIEPSPQGYDRVSDGIRMMAIVAPSHLLWRIVTFSRSSARSRSAATPSPVLTIAINRSTVAAAFFRPAVPIDRRMPRTLGFDPLIACRRVVAGQLVSVFGGSVELGDQLGWRLAGLNQSR